MEFIYSHFLWGLTIIIAPIVIHIITKLLKKKIIFPMIFLFEDELLSTQKSFKIKELFQLFLRILIIIFLCIMLSQPFCNDNISSQPKNKNIIIILDNSISMTLMESSGSLFDIAKSEIKKIIENFYNEDNRIIVFPLIGYKNISSEENYNKDELISFVENIKIIKNDPNIIPFSIKDIITSINNNKYINKSVYEVFIFSDFQSTDWKEVKINDSDNHCENVIYRKLGNDSNNNVAIVNIDQDKELFHFIENGVDVSLGIKNYSSTNKSGNIQYYWEDELIMTVPIDITAKSDMIITKNIKGTFEGYHKGKAIIQFDRFTYDDQILYGTYFKKRVSSLVLEKANDSLIKYAFMNAQTTKTNYKKYNWVTHTAINSDVDYDIIIAYHLSGLNDDELNFIKKHIDNKKPLLLILSDKEDMIQSKRKLGEIFKESKILISDTIKDNVSLIINDTSYQNLISLISKKMEHLYFKKYYTLKYDSNYFSEPISFWSNTKNHKSGAFLLEHYDNNSIYSIITSGINVLNSNILLNQEFALLLNLLIERSILYSIDIRNQINSDKVITEPQYLVESDLTSLTVNEIINMCKEKNYEMYTSEKDFKYIEKGSQIRQKSNISNNYVLISLISLIILFFIDIFISFPIKMSKI